MHSKAPVAATNINKIVNRSKLNGFDDMLVDEPSDFLLVAPAQSEIVEVAGVLGRLAAVFHVVVGTGNHWSKGDFIVAASLARRYGVCKSLVYARMISFMAGVGGAVGTLRLRVSFPSGTALYAQGDRD